jgi:hypothetical protein
MGLFHPIGTPRVVTFRVLRLGDHKSSSDLSAPSSLPFLHGFLLFTNQYSRLLNAVWDYPSTTVLENNPWLSNESWLPSWFLADLGALHPPRRTTLHTPVSPDIRGSNSLGLSSFRVFSGCPGCPPPFEVSTSVGFFCIQFPILVLRQEPEPSWSLCLLHETSS